MSSIPPSGAPPSCFLSRESLAASLAALVRINSVNPAYGGPGGGEASVVAWIGDFLARLGIESHQWDALPGRPNLVATLPGRDPSRTILFCTHTDTVSVRGMTIDPHGGDISDGRLWGRGSTDAKGQLVSILHAFAAVRESGVIPAVNLQLGFTVDEESGFGGIRSLVERGLNVEGAVIGEPTQLEVVVAHKGTQRFWIEVMGRSAHSAKPHLGCNAIDAAARIVLRIQGEYAREIARHSHPLLGNPTVNVSVIEGGTQVNLVPELCRILIDRRTLPGETRASVGREIEAVIRAALGENNACKAHQLEPLMVDPPLETSPDDPLVRLACGIAARHDRSCVASGVPYGTDGSKLSEIGIPTIIVGPGSIDQAHTADEFIELAELDAGALFHYELMTAEFAR